jgi:hypothetical protein
MQSPASSCPYCRVVNLLCFWGPRPGAPWKRAALVLLATPAIIALVVVTWFFWQRMTLLYGICLLLLFLLTVLSVVIGFRGCNACVARLFGGF